MNVTTNSKIIQLGENFIVKSNKNPVPLLEASTFSKDNSLRNWKEGSNEIIKGYRKIRDLRIVWPYDTVYRSLWLTKLLNKMMNNGSKGLAEKIILGMLIIINQKVRNGAGIIFFHQAIDQAKPILSTVSRRVGRRRYDVPVPLYSQKQSKIAIRWLAEIAKKKSIGDVKEVLANEVLNTIVHQRSDLLKRKEDLYDIVVRNRAYMHYRWV